LPASGLSRKFALMSNTDPFSAIADPNRRYLLEELRRAPRTVNELAEGLPISRPAVSQHLKALLESGLVSVKSEGTRRIYAVNSQGFMKLNLWLDQFWA
jgi:DNA-binding transcriptional ArsR family regulator